MHRDHHFRVELLHHISGFRTVVDLGATANAEDQHIRPPQQNLVFRLECCGGATEVGEVQATLLPAPNHAIAKTATAEAVMGSGKAFKAQAFDAVATRAGQKTALRHRCALIQQKAAGQHHISLDPRLFQASRTSHCFERVHQHAGATAIDQQGAMAVAGDRDPISQSRRGQGKCSRRRSQRQQRGTQHGCGPDQSREPSSETRPNSG